MELPCALLRILAPPVCFPGLLDGLGAGLSRGHERCFGLCVVKITLMTRKVDHQLQLVSLLNQSQDLSFKARVHVHKLSTKLAHRIRCLLEELLADVATLLRSLEHVVNIILRHRCWRRALKLFAPSRGTRGGGPRWPEAVGRGRLQ